jgi:hypothetical protein
MLIFEVAKINKHKPTNELEYNEKIFDDIVELVTLIQEKRTSIPYFNKIINCVYDTMPYTDLFKSYFYINSGCWMKYYEEKKFDLKFFGNGNNQYHKDGKKVSNLLSTTMYYPLIKGKDLYTRELMRFEYIVRAMLACFDSLELKGRLLSHFFNFKFKITWQILYLGLQLFDNFIILGVDIVLYRNFNPKITKKEFEKISNYIMEDKHVKIIYYELDILNNHFDDCYKNVKAMISSIKINDIGQYLKLFLL